MRRRNLLTGLAAVLGGSVTGLAAAGVVRVPMSDGASIALEETGTGPSLLLVHGAAGTRASWARVVPLLTPRFRTCAINRRGRLDSPDGGAFSLAREAEDIVRVAERLPRPVFVAAHSYGAIVTLEALRLTDRFARAVLYEPPLPVSGGIVRPPPTAACAAVAAGDNEAAMLSFLGDYAHMPAPVIAGFRADPAWPQRIALAPSACREATAVSAYTFDPARFASIVTPTLFLLGGASPETTATSVRAGATALPNGRIELLDGQRSDAMYAAPALFARIVGAFLLE